MVILEVVLSDDKLVYELIGQVNRTGKAYRDSMKALSGQEIKEDKKDESL